MKSFAATVLIFSIFQWTPVAAQTAAQRARMDRLLAPQKMVATKRSNPVVDGAIACPDLATVDIALAATTRAITERLSSQMNGGRNDLIRRPSPLPDLAAWGCVFLPRGTVVSVEDAREPAIVISGNALDGPFRAVTYSYMLENGVEHGAQNPNQNTQERNNTQLWGLMFKTQVERCWKKPRSGSGKGTIKAIFYIKLKRDGSLDGVPTAISSPATPYSRAYQESALRAIIECQPYNLPAQFFDEWKFFEPIFTERS